MKYWLYSPCCTIYPSSYFIFYWSMIALQCSVSFCWTTKWMSYVCIYIPSLLDRLPPPLHSIPDPTWLGHLGALSWTPWAILQGPTSYLFYAPECMYVSPNLPVHPHPPPRPMPCPRFPSLPLCLYSCPGTRSIRTIFLDSICVNMRLISFVFLLLTYFTLYDSL